MTRPWPIRSRTLRANRPTESAPLPVPPSTRATLPRTCAAGRSDARDVSSLILHCTKFLHAAFRRADRGSRIATLGFVPAAYLIDLPILCSAGPDWHEACKAEATPSPLLAPCVLSRTEQATRRPGRNAFERRGATFVVFGSRGLSPPERNTLMSKPNSSWISEWNPEDETFWKSTGKSIAQRNLIWSIFAEHLGFSIWLIWSIVATKLPQAGFHYTTDQLFQLVALPGLIGSLMRFPYTFAVTTFGGRNWTIFSAVLLFIPTLALAYFVTQPDTPFWMMLLVAATAGLGGGNFASSMANISFFYPDRMKGWALGLNAAGGNIGVSGVQLLTPLLLGFGFVSLYQATPVADGLYLQNAGLMWLLPLVLATAGAFFFMNNLTSARSTLKDQLVIVKRKHTR